MTGVTADKPLNTNYLTEHHLKNDNYPFKILHKMTAAFKAAVLTETGLTTQSSIIVDIFTTF